MTPAAGRPSRRTTLVARLFLLVCGVLAAVDLVIGNGWIGLFLVGAVALVGAGLVAPRSTPPWLATTLVIGGALLGGMMLVWTVIGGLLAVALIAFSIMDRRRGDPPLSPA
jgi:hypothetical protein